MIKSVKCYNLISVTDMLGFTLDKYKEYDEFLKLIHDNGVVVFTPPFYPNGPTRRPFTYLKTNKWFDDYISKNNVMSVLKGNGKIAKPTYRKYEIKKEGLFSEL